MQRTRHIDIATVNIYIAVISYLMHNCLVYFRIYMSGFSPSLPPMY